MKEKTISRLIQVKVILSLSNKVFTPTISNLSNMNLIHPLFVVKLIWMLALILENNARILLHILNLKPFAWLSRTLIVINIPSDWFQPASMYRITMMWIALRWRLIKLRNFTLIMLPDRMLFNPINYCQCVIIYVQLWGVNKGLSQV